MDSFGRFTTRSRWLVGAAGAVMLLAGGAAVYRSDNDAASAALVLVGAIFLLLGVMGQPPSRLKLGDLLEMEFQRADALRSEGRDEEAQLLLSLVSRIVPATQARQRLQESWSLWPASASYRSAASTYERAVLGALQEILSSDEHLDPAAVPSDSAVDAILTIRGVQIGVDIRAGIRFSQSALLSSWVSVSMSDALDVDRFLLVVNAPPSDRFDRLAEDLRSRLRQPVEIATWRSGDPTDMLRRAIDRLAPPEPTAHPVDTNPAPPRRGSGMRPRRGSAP